jgi:4-hydroxybenzoate polyprenyltransferase
MLKKIKNILEMIKFHTVFALPFAFTGAVLAANGLPTGYQAFWILVAMVGAHRCDGPTRLIDAKIDARNPAPEDGRSRRPVGQGRLLRSSFSLALFVYAAYRLNDLCLYLSPLAVILLVSYSYCKRFTSMSHLVLGLCLAVARRGLIAVKGTLEVPALLLGFGVLFCGWF